MGRRFTKSSNDYIECTTAAGLNGFTFAYGTFATAIYIVSSGGGLGGCLESTNNASGACFDLLLDGAGALDIWDGTNDRLGPTPATGAPLLIAVTKATGTTTARGHVYTFATGAWVHSAFSGTSVDSAATTSITFGSETPSVNPLDAEIWAIGMWNKVVMTDSEVERLARGNWLNLEPSFYEQWTDGREVGDMVRTLGRTPLRQTGRSGTTRGAQKPPPGFCMDARRHRR